MKYLLLILLTLSLVSCGGKSYSYIADPVIASYSKEMKKKRSYWVEGTGGSMPCNDVRNIFISFSGIYEVDLPEARRRYVEVVEGLIRTMNSDLDIRPYLHDYPATCKNTRIHLCFVDRHINPTAENFISFVFLVDGIICYNTYNAKNHEYKIVFEEPYEEALRIVQSE